MGGGDPESGHHGVADELLHRAALCLDLGPHRLEIGLHYLVEILGIETLRERRRIGNIGEEDSHQLALGRDRACHRDGSAAVRAETGVLGQRGRTVGTGPRQVMTAYRAEPGVVRIDMPARRTIHPRNLLDRVV